MSRSIPRARDHRAVVLRRRIATDRARHAIATALFEAVADGIEFGPRDLSSSADREWLRGAVAIPIQESADDALDAIVWRLSDLLGRAPGDMAARFIESDGAEDPCWD
jgi:hypothetical protein